MLDCTLRMRNRSALPPFATLCCIVLASASCVGEAPASVAAGDARAEDIFLPPDPPPAPPATRRFEGTVPNGATLSSLLAAHDLRRPEVARVIEAAREVFDPRRMRRGNAYSVEVARDGTLRRFEYEVDGDRFLEVRERTVGAGGFQAALLPYVKERVEVARRGFIDRRHTSLVAALNGAGETQRLAIKLAGVLAGEIDFNTELQSGDRFDVLFEKQFRAGEFAGYGDVLAASVLNAGRRLEAFRFTLPGAAAALYYDAQGRSLRRPFLRSPFQFEPRVTSRFSRRRLHPILGTYRPHLGVDYGAPTGTPVVAVADGTVVSAGRRGASGNMVRLRHTNGYETYYLHLSAFAPGVRPGARLRQGQTIGRVGATGMATGPHLDYRMSRNGKFVDPALEHQNLPSGEPVPARHLAAFLDSRDRLLERLSAALARDSAAAPAAD